MTSSINSLTNLGAIINTLTGDDADDLPIPESGQAHPESGQAHPESEGAGVDMIRIPDSDSGILEDPESTTITQDDAQEATEEAAGPELGKDATTGQDDAQEATEKDYTLDECSQTGIAQVFAYTQGDVVRYIKAKDDFMVWNGHRWGLSEKARDELRYVETTLRGIIQHYPKYWEEGSGNKPGRYRDPPELTFARGQLKFDKNVNAIAQAARRIEAMREDLVRFDAKPDWLLFKNGVLDLREKNGKLRKPEKGMFLTQMIPFDYDPTLRSQLREDFYKEIFNNDEETIYYLQEAIGYGITGRTDEECLWMFVGKARAGKGTLLSQIVKFMGLDYADTIGRKSIMTDGENRIRCDLAVIWNLRFLRCSELDENDSLSTTVKTMTGGDDITARFLHHDPFTYKPKFKLFIDTNDKPKVLDHYTYSRIRVVEFPNSYLGRENPELKKQLTSPKELQRLGPWLVEGARRWYQQGKLLTPQKVLDALADYKLEDPMYRFVQTCVRGLKFLGNLETQAWKAEDIKDRYEAFLMEEGLYQGPVSQTWFGNNIKKHISFDKKRLTVDGKKITYYLGLRPTPPIVPADPKTLC